MNYMALDINSIIILISLFLIYGIFLFFDLFRKNQNYGYFAYFMAVLPVNYLWVLEDIDVLTAYLVLFILWDITLVRDFFMSVREQRNHVATLLFLAIGILVQIVVTAVLPEIVITAQANCYQLWYFWFPEVYVNGFEIATWVSSSILLGFRVAATILVLLAIVPLIVYLKTSGEQSLLDLIIVDAIFIVPFIFLSYIWLATALWVLTFLFAVILLIVLLLITKQPHS